MQRLRTGEEKKIARKKKPQDSLLCRAAITRLEWFGHCHDLDKREMTAQMTVDALMPCSHISVTDRWQHCPCPGYLYCLNGASAVLRDRCSLLNQSLYLCVLCVPAVFTYVHLRTHAESKRAIERGSGGGSGQVKCGRGTYCNDGVITLREFRVCRPSDRWPPTLQ